MQRRLVFFTSIYVALFSYGYARRLRLKAPSSEGSQPNSNVVVKDLKQVFFIEERNKGKIHMLQIIPGTYKAGLRIRADLTRIRIRTSGKKLDLDQNIWLNLVTNLNFVHNELHLSFFLDSTKLQKPGPDPNQTPES